MSIYVKEQDGLHKVINDITVFTGATESDDGTNGLVIQPHAGDNHRFLQGDATWGKVPDKIIYNDNLKKLQLYAENDLVSECDMNAKDIISNDTYTITFNPNGGSGGGTMKVAINDKIGILANATRSSYELDGWYTSSSGGTRITANTIPTRDTTYYAHWKPMTTNSIASSFRYNNEITNGVILPGDETEQIIFSCKDDSFNSSKKYILLYMYEILTPSSEYTITCGLSFSTNRWLSTSMRGPHILCSNTKFNYEELNLNIISNMTNGKLTLTGKLISRSLTGGSVMRYKINISHVALIWCEDSNKNLI